MTETLAQKLARIKAERAAQAQQPTGKPTIQELLAKAKAASAVAETQPQAMPQAVTPPPKPKYTLPSGTEQLEADKPDLCNALRSLVSSLHEEQEGIPFWLDRVHEQLRGEPELVHMLTDEQQAAVYQSIIKQSSVQIIAPKTKAASRSTPKVTAGSGDAGEM